MIAATVARLAEMQREAWACWADPDENSNSEVSAGKLEDELALDVTVSATAARIKLTTALDHMVRETWAIEAVHAGDVATLFARAKELNFDARMIVSALVSLEGLA